MYGEVDTFLILALVSVSADRQTLSLYLLENNHRHPVDRRLGNHRAGVVSVMKRKTLPLPGIEPRFPLVGTIAQIRY
jgi:hypothetical protein